MSGLLTIPAADYHADLVADVPTLSASIAKILCTASPAHAFAAHPKLNPDFERKVSDSFDLGTCAHSLLLEGVENVHIVEKDNWSTKDAKEEREEARANGRVPLLRKDWERVCRMTVAADRQLDALHLNPRPFTNGKPEVTLVWEMEGVACRALIDWLHEDAGTVCDYKTTSASAHPAAWPKTALGIGADIQIAMHSAGVEQCFGQKPEWRYIVQETYPPYALSVIAPDKDWLEIGQDKLDYALRTWKQCMETGVWAGYPQEVAYAELPGWAMTQWMEREAMPV